VDAFAIIKSDRPFGNWTLMSQSAAVEEWNNFSSEIKDEGRT
jgi:hypothetical protein